MEYNTEDYTSWFNIDIFILESLNTNINNSPRLTSMAACV